MRLDCHLINLDRNPERLQQFLRRFWRSGLRCQRLWRLSGIDARTRWEEIGGLVDPRAHATCSGKMRTFDSELPSRGGAGCFLSHLLAHKKLLESGDEATLIFEDDASIPRKGVDTTVLMGAPRDWDVVLLGCHAVQGADRVGTWRSIRRFVGLHAYAISAEGDRKVLSSQSLPMVMQIDAYLSWLALRGQLKIYATRHNCVNQRMTKSDVQKLHVTQNSIWLGKYGFEHEPEDDKRCHLESNRKRLELLRPSWNEIRKCTGEEGGSAELKASSWTWTPWER